MMRALCAVLVVLAGPAMAVDLQLPTGARQTIARDTVADRYAAPVGVFAQGAVPTVQIDGPIARSAWRIDVAGLMPLQIIAPLRAQLEAAGYRIVLDCAARDCGGYDFRFATEVLSAPNMSVNISDYHVITGLLGPVTAPVQAVSVLVSAASGATFIQIIQAGVGEDAPSVTAVAPPPDAEGVPPIGELAELLEARGHALLGGLDFESGTSALGAGPFEALAALAEVLRAQPTLQLAIVGHTDNIGGLAPNIDLSRSRAAAVRERLIDNYGIAPARLEAEGMGYLAPLTENRTEAGREANRRVEAVVLAR